MHESVSMTSTSEYIDTRSAALLGGFAFAVEAAAVIVSGPFFSFFLYSLLCLPLLLVCPSCLALDLCGCDIYRRGPLSPHSETNQNAV